MWQTAALDISLVVCQMRLLANLPGRSLNDPAALAHRHTIIMMEPRLHMSQIRRTVPARGIQISTVRVHTSNSGHTSCAWDSGGILACKPQLTPP
jgi:hypothetical protein